MRFLRTVSTQRLLALIAGLVIAIAGGTAIAVAAAGKGPVPRAESLAKAVRGVLATHSIPGISARVTFTNHLIDASNIQGSDPILQGASGRLWFSPATHQLRIELQSDNGDAQAVVSHNSFWLYDPASNTVYKGTLPAHAATKKKKADKAEKLPSIAQIQSELNKLAGHANVSGAIPGDVASQPTYTVRISPKHDGGLLGNVQMAWDAIRGVPLRFGIYARGDSTPVLELKATDISYGSVPSSDFAISPPSGAKVVRISAPATTAHAHAHRGDRRAERAQRLNFKAVAPKTLVGLPRQSVTRVDMGAHPAVLVSYGQNLGGIVVLEQRASSAGAVASAGHDHAGLSLPTVSINGTSAQELDTALGTVLRFTRGQVTYTVLGSVPPAAAEAAARAL